MRNSNKGPLSIVGFILRILYILMLILLIYLVIDFGGNSSDILSQYVNLTSDSKSDFSKSLQFLKTYTQTTGDITLALNTGMSKEDAEELLEEGNMDIDGGYVGSTTPASSIPTDVNELLQLLLSCGIKDNSGDANCNKVFEILYPNSTQTYSQLKNWSSSTEAAINQLNSSNLVSVSVPVWQFKNYNPNSTDLTKEDKTISVQCSKYMVPLVKQIFKEIHDSPDKPVIMYAGGLKVRAMNNGTSSNGRVTSTHSYGGTIDINAYAGGSQIIWNWNGSRNNTTKPYPVSAAAWNNLPHNQYKYLCLYDGCTIVSTFEKYGFYWGGRWSSAACDPMHFSVFDH